MIYAHQGKGVSWFLQICIDKHISMGELIRRLEEALKRILYDSFR